MKNYLWFLAVFLLLLIGCQKSLRFVNHPQPKFTVDFSVFENVGCPLSEYGSRHCEEESLLATLGCDQIRQPSNLLGALEPSLPIAMCLIDDTTWSVGHDVEKVEVGWDEYTYNANGDYFFRIGGLFLSSLFQYVVLQDGHFILIETEDEFREVFAPIESSQEALSYTIAVTGLSAYYGLEHNPGYEYFVDEVIEDTHVDKVKDGYSVNLYRQDVYGCGPHPTYAVNFHITFEGHISQRSIEPIYNDPSQNHLCVD